MNQCNEGKMEGRRVNTNRSAAGGRKNARPLRKMEEKEDSSHDLLEQTERRVQQADITLDPAMCSISYDQFMELDRMGAAGVFGPDYDTMTTRDINDEIIKPLCVQSRTPYAQQLNPNGLMLDAFVTHSWDEPFKEFVRSIHDLCLGWYKRPNLWICAFALSQSDLGTKLDVPIAKSPFVTALREAKMFVVVRNSKIDLYSRIWCVCELFYAERLGLIAPGKMFVTGPDNYSNVRKSCVDAESSNVDDKVKILNEVLCENEKYKEIDELIRRFRSHGTEYNTSNKKNQENQPNQRQEQEEQRRNDSTDNGMAAAGAATTASPPAPPPVQNISVQNGGAPHDEDSTLGARTRFMIRLDDRRHRQGILVAVTIAIFTGVVVPVIVTQTEKNPVVISPTPPGPALGPSPTTTQNPTAVETRDPSPSPALGPAPTAPPFASTQPSTDPSPTETPPPPTGATTTENPTRRPTTGAPTSAPAPAPSLAPMLTAPPPLEPPSLAPATSGGLQPDGPWKPLGQKLGGKAWEDYFGISVSLSRDARVFAVGAHQSYPNRAAGVLPPYERPPGYVSVFESDEPTGSWVAKGQELVGEAKGDRFGESVALNGDGTILAVGATWNDGGGDNAGHVRVFEYDKSTNRWVQLGSDIDGEAAHDVFGCSVSLSKAGDILAAGALNGGDDGRGSVRTFKYDHDNNSWGQLGKTLVGQAAGDAFGASVSLSSTGTIVAVGAITNDSGGAKAGQVSMYEYSFLNSFWDPMGSPINGQIVDGLFGLSLSLDNSGLVVAVGAPGVWYDSDFTEARVLVYEYDRAMSAWTPRGQTLESRQSGNQFGFSVSLSGNGNVLAEGSPWHDANGLTMPGQVTIFQYNTNKMEWDAIGEPLNGKAADDNFGESVSLSEDGTVVAVGAYKRDFNGMAWAGSATVYTLN